MKIISLKSFIKSYEKLQKRDQLLVDQAIEKFIQDPFHPDLANHPLVGSLSGKRALSVKHDLRILYREEGGHQYIYLILVGSHAQVYKM